VKRLMIGMVMSAALVLGPVMVGCGGECDKQCDKFIKCMKDMSGGKLKEDEGKLKKECVKECKKDKKKFKKQLKQICGK